MTDFHASRSAKETTIRDEVIDTESMSPSTGPNPNADGGDEYGGTHPTTKISQGDAALVNFMSEDRGNHPSPSRNNSQDLDSEPFGENKKDLATDPSLEHASPVIPNNRLIRGTDGETEKLDLSYAKRSGDYKKFFRPGRVFSTLWTEPYETSNDNDSLFNTVVTYKVKYGQRVYSKIRRFVVVELDETRRSCTCLPIISYGGKGYRKRGINLDNHGLIYNSQAPPPRVKGITKEPLRIISSEGVEHLNNSTLINYGRVYTVETNVKVKDVGNLTLESKALLQTYYQGVLLELLDYDNDIAVVLGSSTMDQPNLSIAPSDVPRYIPDSYQQQPCENISGEKSGYANHTYLATSSYRQPERMITPGNAPAYNVSENYILDSNDDQLGFRSHRQYHFEPQANGIISSSPRIPSASSEMYLPTEGPSYRQDSSLWESFDVNSHSERDQIYPEQQVVGKPHRPPPDDDVRQSDEADHPADWPSKAFSDDFTVPVFEYAQADEQCRESTPYGEDSANVNTGHSSYHTIDNTPQVTDHAMDRSSSSTGLKPIYAEDVTESTSRITSVNTWLSSIVHANSESIVQEQFSPEARRVTPPLRRASVESLESLVFSSKKSDSSCSSLASQRNGAERLIDVLRQDNQLKKLYAEAASKVDPEKFRKNFRRCLIQCSEHLKAESALNDSRTRKESIDCARAVRRYSREAATDIGNSLQTRDLRLREPHEDMLSDDSDTDDGLDPLQNPNISTKDISEPLSLECTLTSSAAFRLLKENLSLFLNPDPVKRALFTTWPVIHSRSLPLTIQYHVSWFLTSFLRSHFSCEESLKNVLTITGQAPEYEARSCGDYLTDTWPEVGSLLLDALQTLVGGNPSVEIQNENLVLSLKILDELEDASTISVAVTAVHTIHAKAASAISWLCSALRSSPHIPVACSTASVEAVKSKSTELIIQILSGDLQVIIDDQACWHPLFPHTVLAEGYPIRDRVEGKGLDISFGNMAMMGQSLRLVEYDGGLILEGLRAFLIPKALLSDGSVQWHFEHKRLGHCRKPRKLFEVLRQVHLIKRYKSLDVEDLIGRRCFLGWADEVEVIIATESYSTKRIHWSESDKVQGSAHLKSHGITTGTEGLGIWGVSANRTWLPIAVPSRITLRQNKDISDTLDDECEARVMVYDTETKISHLLPQADVTLFLAHRVLRRRQQILSDDKGEAVTLPYASADFKALDILQNCLSFDMSRRGSGRNPTRRYFGDLVKEIWNALDCVENALVSNEVEWTTVDKGAPEYLHGVEFRDLEDMKPSMRISQAKVDKPWVHLVVTEPTVPVLFCQGLGQPIVTRNPGLLCESWLKVPQGHNYMVATCDTICSWLDRHDNGEGSRLSERVEWKVDSRVARKGLIYSHGNRKNGSVHHEQQLSFVKKASMNTKIYELVRRFENGGLIFGSTHLRKPCSEKLSQPIGPARLETHHQIHSHMPIFVSQQPSDVPEGSSDTSVETDVSLSVDGPSSTPSLSSSQLSQADQETLSDIVICSPPLSLPTRIRCQPQHTADTNLEDVDLSRTSDNGNPIADSTPRLIKRKKRQDHLRGGEDAGGGWF
ncbi:hypothetical protein VTL71DRAFT_3819 [Oculimacula yallundae]|uniref:DUF6590 domain-containing protein n=1 Tax=Oculimacula yallundae TaxID=86028 RepID=A0ABR4C5S5_9HELO